jgi:hypothetical protein
MGGGSQNAIVRELQRDTRYAITGAPLWIVGREVHGRLIRSRFAAFVEPARHGLETWLLAMPARPIVWTTLSTGAGRDAADPGLMDHRD